MELSLSEEKVQKILMRCQKTLDQKLVSVREVSQLIGTLSSTALAVLPAPLMYCYLQKQQIGELSTSPFYKKTNSIITSKQSWDSVVGSQLN